MIEKTTLGIQFFDDRFGGIFAHRPVLMIGRQGSGKTIAALQALVQGHQQGKRSLMLSGWRADDLQIVAARMGLPLAAALKSKQVMLLEYAHLILSPEHEEQHILPAGSFLEFQQIIEEHRIRRVVIDTILPWVAIRQVERLGKHVYSFIQALERLGVTSVLTIPRPVSTAARALRDALESQIPVVLTLDRDPMGAHSLVVDKYIGENNLPVSLPFAVTPGDGIQLTAAAPPISVPAHSPPAPPPGAAPSAAAARKPIRYADAFPNI